MNKIMNSNGMETDGEAHLAQILKSTTLEAIPLDDSFKVKYALEAKLASKDGIMFPKTYTMLAKPRGNVLIINNIDFETESKRLGAENDQRVMKDLFEQLYFKVECYTNSTADEMSDILTDFAKKPDWWNADCGVVIVMSHGLMGDSVEDTEILGTDEYSVKTWEIIQLFNNYNCPGLAGKPKIFIFQACRGGNLDNGYRKTYFHLPTHLIQTDGTLPKSDEANGRMPTSSDMFVAYAVSPGNAANRDTREGAWFIQTIAQVFAEHACQHHLEDLLKIVANKVGTRDCFNMQAVSTNTIYWGGQLYFNPGIYDDGNCIVIEASLLLQKECSISSPRETVQPVLEVPSVTDQQTDCQPAPAPPPTRTWRRIEKEVSRSFKKTKARIKRF